MSDFSAQDPQPRSPDNDSEHPPRTRHLLASGAPRYTNELIHQNSPYLLQHAHNPVNWLPWDDTAFALAHEQNKPVFLSIGYATCHWCHVMEDESFEDIDVAHFLNEHFISIKVDREVLPDVDSFYMTVLVMLTRQGGWPMSSFLCPDGKPFFAGTYYPTAQFLQLLQQVQYQWQHNQDMLQQQAEKITQQVHASQFSSRHGAAVTEKAIDQALSTLRKNHDTQYGGFGSAPKFPNEPQLFLLLEAAVLYPDQDYLQMATQQLQSMSAGGIYDHVGGGFHRYSTDPYWLVPHFEKMLYNQANLVRLYTRAWEITNNRLFQQITCETLDYVLRELRHPLQAFYSATDADSEGVEGKYFVWDVAEIQQLLSPGETELASSLFGISTHGNFIGSNILHLPSTYDVYAKENGCALEELLQQSKTIRNKLLQGRKQRPAPLLDNKIICGWNAMMISALSTSGKQMGFPHYIAAAVAAAEYLLEYHRPQPDTLLRISIDGNAATAGRQEDYALLAEALIQLYDDTGESRWLNHASEICTQMVARFYLPEQGVFCMNTSSDTDDKQPLLPVNPIANEDNATPSGNAVAMRTLTKLYRRTGDDQWQQITQNLQQALGEMLTQYPHACCYLLTALLENEYHEQGNLQYAGNGKVRISAQLPKREINPEVAIHTTLLAPAWQIQRLQVVAQKLYPFPHSDRAILKLQLELELCDANHCLPVETLPLSVALDNEQASSLPLAVVYSGDFTP